MISFYFLTASFTFSCCILTFLLRKRSNILNMYITFLMLLLYYKQFDFATTLGELKKRICYPVCLWTIMRYMQDLYIYYCRIPFQPYANFHSCRSQSSLILIHFWSQPNLLLIHTQSQSSQIIIHLGSQSSLFLIHFCSQSSLILLLVTLICFSLD